MPLTIPDTTSIIDTAYPVGSIYIEITGTNPGTTFGVGTWTAFGAGKVIVGRDSGDTDFDTAEETGGAKTVAHTHTLSSAGAALITLGTTAGQEVTIQRINNPDGSWTGTHDIDTAAAGAASNSRSTAAALDGATDSSSPSVVQPYIVVYMWKRTA